jgi:hypothetical protein
MVLTSKKVWPPPDEPRSDVTQTAIQAVLVSCSRNTRHFVAIKMGRWHGGPGQTGAPSRTGGPSRTGAKGAYLNRYATDPAAAG